MTTQEPLNIAHDRKELFMYYMLARRTNTTLDVEGPPGSGKTEMIGLLAEMGRTCLPEALDPDSLPDGWVPRTSIFYLSQWSGDDMVGYPMEGPDGLTFLPPMMLRKLREGDFLVCDEKTTPCAPSSIKGMLQLTQGERAAIGDWVGPDNVTRITLGNGAEHGNVDYEANPVQGNRVTRLTYLGPTVDEWLEYVGPKGIHPVIGTYVRMEGRDALNAFDPELDRSPTPRSWWNASRSLLSMEDMLGGRRAVRTHQRMAVASTAVGDYAAIQLETIFELADTMVPFSEIATNPLGAHVPSPSSEPNELFLCVTHVGNRTRPEHWENVAQYIARLPIEMQGTVVAPILKRHPELITTPEFMEYSARTAGLVID